MKNGSKNGTTRVAIICSNVFNIDSTARNGTAIFNYDLVNNLRLFGGKKIDITVFASGESRLPVRTKSIARRPSSANDDLMKSGKHINFELALIAKALSRQKDFDLFHVNIGDGDIVVPFSGFVEKPVLITLHHIIDADFTRKYFSMFQKNKKVFFNSVSNSQRKILPGLNYAANIYHGLDINKFHFDPKGGRSMIWVGRAIPQKGLARVIEIAHELNIKTKIFGIVKFEYQDWLKENVLAKIKSSKRNNVVEVHFNRGRAGLIREYQKSKVFLSSIGQEETFGLTLIESMACGTPVVAFARGSIPEIMEDGKTGFIINPSDRDIRGDWIVKEAGNKGLAEAVRRIYSMPQKQYLEMRESCRRKVEENFTVEGMAKNYLELYLKLSAK